MKLSICLPTYNRADLLRQTLGSLLPQVDFTKAEVIISDNASTDHTKETVNSIRKNYPALRYFRNRENVGMDDNTLLCLKYAAGEYVWLCSDDDIALPGSFEKVLQVIEKHKPALLYLNHAGYLEGEDFHVVLERSHDKEDVVYRDAEQMIRAFRLNHFSSTIMKREAALKYIPATFTYKSKGYGRGYAFVVIAHYLVLQEPGPFVYVGKVCLAVRNPQKVDYNPLLVIIIDHARLYQGLVRQGLIKEGTERHIINWFIRGLWQILLPLKCRRDPSYTAQLAARIHSLYKKYPLYYIYMYPVIALPRWVLLPPYLAARSIKRKLK